MSTRRIRYHGLMVRDREPQRLGPECYCVLDDYSLPTKADGNPFSWPVFSVESRRRIADQARAATVCDHMEKALRRLDQEEKQYIIRYYYLTESLSSIMRQSGRTVSRLESLRQRSLRKLKSELTPFVERFYRLSIARENEDCPICNSIHREEIDALIAGRDRTQTLKPLLKTLRERYGIRLSCVQVLLSHEKYH